MDIDDYVDSFITGYCEDVLINFPDDSVDFIITSPPYTDQRSYGSTCHKIKSDDYIDWILPKIIEFKRVLKSNGSFVLNINNRVEYNFEQLFIYELVLKICNEVGFNLVRDYIWYNPSSPPNAYSRGTLGRTKKSHEHCFWFSKSDDWTFNMDPIRKPYSKDMEKYLKGKGKGNRSKNTRPSTHTFDCEKVWKNYGGADPGSVIVCGNSGSRDPVFQMFRDLGIKHPARFPKKLVEFFIKSGTNEGDLVLDPFSGSGTTAVVCDELNRHWIGIDCNPDYNRVAKRRLDKERENREL